jgi:hypothetical protein
MITYILFSIYFTIAFLSEKFIENKSFDNNYWIKTILINKNKSYYNIVIKIKRYFNIKT